MIDLHCHLLPGIDDGPATMEESLALACAASAAGTRTIAATPHIDHRYEVTGEQVAAGVEGLTAALTEAGIDLEVRRGGEIALDRLIHLDRSERDRLRLGGGPFLLLEAPLSPAAGNFDAFLSQLRDQGEQILLAHPERCPAFQRRPERLTRLVDAGVLCSITASSLSGAFGAPVRSFTLDLLREGLVHDVASDSHGALDRAPDLVGPFPEIERELPGVSDQAQWLTVDAPHAILTGSPLPAKPPLPVPRRRLRLKWPRAGKG